MLTIIALGETLILATFISYSCSLDQLREGLKHPGKGNLKREPLEATPHASLYIKEFVNVIIRGQSTTWRHSKRLGMHHV
jgi:hypothetical protein